MKRGPKPKGRVDQTWRPELAYAIGLITADGSLSKNGRHINFTSKDLDLIHTFQKCLGLENIKIGKKTSGYTDKKYYFVQFGDVLFYEFLVTIGLHPDKSRSLKEIQIPELYFFDFLRGEWDGDGTIYCSRDMRWKNSFVVSAGFTSASKCFLQWLQLSINKRLDTNGFITPVQGSYQLRYAKKDSILIMTAMFYYYDLPHLKRKFAKAKEIYRINDVKMPRWWNR